MHMIRKGQMGGVEKGDLKAQNTFIANLFGLAARAVMGQFTLFGHPDFPRHYFPQSPVLSL